MGDSPTRPWIVPVALLVLLGAVPCGPRPGEAADPAAGAELVNIEVVVTDRGGNPVIGLEPADFEASIDGVPTRILTLTPPADPSSAPTADSTAAVSRNLSLILYIDSTGVDAKRRAEVLEHVRTSISDNLGELDRIKVVAAQMGVARTEQSFTGDTTLIAQALDRIEQSVPQQGQEEELKDLMRGIERMLEPAQNRFDPESERDSQTIAQQLRAYANQQRQGTLATRDQLEAAAKTLTGLPGRRTIIYIGAGMPLNPGEDLLNAVKSARPAIRAESPLEGPSTNLPLDLGQSTAQVITDFGRSSSLDGVKIFSFDVGRGQSTMSTTSETGIADAGSTQPGENFSRPAISFGSQTDSEASLRILAAETGGLTVRKHRAVDATLRRLIDDREGAYTLAFAPPDSAAGSAHSIDISANRKGLRVRHRKSFRTPDEDDLVVDMLRTALMGAATGNPLEAWVDHQNTGPLEGTSYSVKLSIRVPVENLALEPLEQSHKAQITVFAVAGDGDLWTSPIHKAVLPITIANDEMLATMGRSVEYEVEMRVFSGREHLALAVRDDLDPRLSILTLAAAEPGDGDPPGR